MLGHLPDPFHRVDIRHSTRTIRVRGPGGSVLAESGAPLVLSERIPDRIHLPRADVRIELDRSERVTVCPIRLAGFVSFAGEGIEVEELS